MSFTIPNEIDAFNSNQAEVDTRDIEILVAGVGGVTGVSAGCGVTPQAAPDMTVVVAAGTVVIGGTSYAAAGSASLALAAADVTNPRFDLVTVDTAGVVAIVTGSPSSEPVFPAIPADRVVLAAIYVQANETTILANRITDKRIIVPASPPASRHTIQEEGANLTDRGKLNFIGAALNAADNAGAARTDVTLSQSPASASVVGTGRTITTTAPITGGGDLSADRTLGLTTSPAGQTPVGVSRVVGTTLPVAGGGDLTADRTISLQVTPTFDGGAVAKQAATPGTAQTGHFNITGIGIASEFKSPDANGGFDIGEGWLDIVGRNNIAGSTPVMEFLRGRGTFASPLPVQSGDGLGDLTWYGQKDTIDGHWLPGAQIRAVAAENFDGTHGGSYLSFLTTSYAGLNPSEKMRLAADGKLSVQNWITYYDGTQNRSLKAYGVRPEDYGAVADGKIVDDASITSGSANLTTVAGAFTAADVGKTIWVFRAGAAGATLKTTILAVGSSTSITLNTTAGATVVQTKTWWGTDNTTAVTNALSEGGALIFSQGIYIVDGTLTLNSQNFSIRGQGSGRSILCNAKTNGNHFSFGFAGANITLSDLSLYGPGLPMTSGAAIAFPNGTYFTCALRNLEIRDVWDGLSVAVTGGPNLQQVDFFGINNIAVNFSGGSLIYYRGLIYNFPKITGGTLAITSGTPNLTSTVAAFTAEDIGKRIAVVGAGAAGATLITTITAVSSDTAATLAANAGTTVSGKVGAMTPPSVAGIAMYNGTPYVSTVDIVGQNVNVLIAPGGGQSVVYGFWHNLLCDSPHDVGLHIAPTTAAAGAVVSHNFINCWFASAGASAQLDGGTNQQGVRIVAAAAGGNITGIRFSAGCRFVNSVKGGLFADGGGAGRITNLTIDGCEFDGNASTSNTYDEISLANVTDLAITDNHISHTFFSAGVTDRYGINLASSCAGTIRYSGNVIINAATADILDATTVTTKVMSNPKAATVTLSNGLNSNIDSLANDLLIVVGPTGAFSLGGLTKGCDGRVVRVLNTLNQTMTIVNEDASSSAANRITTLTGGNVVLRANLPSMATLIYRADAFRWVLASSN